MMKLCKAILIICMLWCAVSVAQNDSINRLEKVTLLANTTKKQEELGLKKVELSVEQVVKNPTNFTELLRYNSPIAFKDYGNGGASSARFRGTSATNTLVLWNGVSINAIGNGQVDFNAISASTSDNITVNSGGGSVQFGSGAIGGVVQLNDILEFREHQDFDLFTSYGSFNTTSNFFKANIGTGKWAVKVASTYNKSDNDYEYLDTRYKDENGKALKNINGNYKNYGVDFSLGYQFSSLNKIYFYTTKYYGNRLFSDGLPNPSAGTERNEDFNQRNLLKWDLSFNSFKQSLKIAYLTQEFRYYGDKEATEYNFGKSNQKLVNYDLSYRFSNYLRLKYTIAYKVIDGATNDLESRKRNGFTLGGAVFYVPTETLTTSFQIRRESNSDFSVPMSVSVAAEKKLNKSIVLKTNLSTNYRIPTYNELYWPVVGNLDLVPEKSKQLELGVDVDVNKLHLSATYFYIHIDDKIIWLPTGGTNLWRPKNIQKVVNQGFETSLSYTLRITKNQELLATSNYTFTNAVNKKTEDNLPFVPNHLLNYNLEYTYKKISLYAQGLYQSKVYTTEDSIDFYSIDAVRVLNTGINFTLFIKENTKLVLGGKINNIGNNTYYFTNLRPMPGRNYNLNIHYKF
ncbi:iron complex outermembrane receptor protein [Wenyingzhuangia heitensis]|uniref:Iron complex outermembrane receptor protein n=1 Tax=Wenyingzhuangia heitensis TaxID=1487859 RepID=A0ABX0UFS9_9FLAO|nr:TonB-dependent receptor [Wenyingzhuangia heitensis]NIJ46271.1 iron complex outermembrane receptor protein [Wenyingzhuangia heitensis]